MSDPASKSAGATSLYLLSFVGLGLVNASLGPSLPHLARHTGVGLAVISSIFVAYRCGYLVGSFAGGRLFDRLPGNRFLALLLLLLAAGVVFVPLAGSLLLLLVALAMAGVMGGAIDVGGNVLLVWSAPRRLGSLMSLLHLAFGVGAFLSPIFLAQALRWTGDIHGGYWALIIFLIIPGVWLIGLRSPRPEQGRGAKNGGSSPSAVAWFVILFLLLYVGAEAAYGGWIYTYAFRRGIATEFQAGYLTSVYWGAYSVGRLTSAIAALRLSPGTILKGSVLGSLLSLLLILVLPGFPAATWIGSIGFGFFMGPIFPTALIYANDAIGLSGKITGLFLVGSSIGSVVVPWLIGQLFEPVGPIVVVLIILTVMTLAALTLFGVMWAVRRG